MWKMSFLLILVAFLGCGIVGADSNSVNVPEKVEYNSLDVSSEVKAKTKEIVQKTTDGMTKIVDESKKRSENIDIYEHAIKAYSQSVTNLQWALAIILTVFSGFVLVLLFKNKQEYKDALGQSREASREARKAAQDSVGYADKMRDKLESVDPIFDKKIKEMDEMVEEERERIRKQGKKVLDEIGGKGEINILWSEGLRACELKNYVEMAAKFEMIIKEYEYENADVYINWGLAFGYDSDIRGGDEKLLEEAISKFQKAIGINPDYYLAHQCYGWVLSRMSDLKNGDEGLLEEAISEYKKSIGINPDYYETHYGYGYVLGKMSDLKDGDGKMLEEAISEYKKAIKIKPGSYEAHDGYGYALVEMSDLKDGDEKMLEQAISKLQKAIEIKPDAHYAYNNWGWALLGLSALKGVDKELLKEAEEKLLKAEKIKRGSGAYNLACVRCQLDDIEGCKKWLEVAEEEGKLFTREHAMGDDDLVKVKDEEWFKKLRWKVR